MAPKAGAAQVGLNIASLMNARTPADGVAAALGIVAGAAAALAGSLPPAVLLTPKGAALKVTLTVIVIGASSAQLAIQEGSATVNDSINAVANSWNSLVNDIDNLFNDLFIRAKAWTWPRCPIVLDLDGDGLETVGLAANIHFDHDGDGVLTRTGWVGGDDALLVLDRNADGLIGSGAELFGDFTPLPNGALAPDGYAALAVLDANRDGVLDARDPAFADLKLWRDVSQDGVSQPGEFMTLAEAGIVSLDLAHTAHNQRLANGNTLTAQGSFTRADGSRGGMGEFLFAIDTFTTRFATPIEVPEALRGLPDVGGSGNVRDLQQAAAQSPALAALLGEFAAAPSRSAQLALLDTLLDQWADTSGMAKSLEERSGGRYRIRYQGFGSERRSAHVIGSAPNEATLMSDLDATTHLSASYRALIGEWSRKLQVLEAFNGQHLFILPHERSQGAPAVWGLWVEAATGSTPPRLWVDFSQPQLDLLQQAWDSLTRAVGVEAVLVEFNVSTLGGGNDTVTATGVAEIVLGNIGNGRFLWGSKCANDRMWEMAA
jgi:hypothetical protein